MRPDVAEAFDRMAAAAEDAGIMLVINSAFRSDAEQTELWRQNPDPRWVAPPGQSLHRCATELDLGPSRAHGWLAAHAGASTSFRDTRGSLGTTATPEARRRAPMPARGGDADGRPRAQPTGGLPSFVPAKYREPILRAAARWNVSAGLLAAQLLVESNFKPFHSQGVTARTAPSRGVTGQRRYCIDDVAGDR